MFQSNHPIQIISKFATASGGTEQRAVRLGQILSKAGARVKLWATHEPDPALLTMMPITTIDLRQLRFPVFGTFIFVGCYLHIGRWIRLAHPSRRVIIFNTKNPEELERMAKQIAGANGLDACELVYSDESLRTLIGRPGPVHQSPIDLERFKPAKRPVSSTAPFTVGRLSRDYGYKFHENDPELFKRLASENVLIRLMGGTCLAEQLQGISGIKLLGEGSEPANEFLNSLDCFLYRTSANWFETYGRVVFEAMACGLPVVVGADGGYAQYVEHGVNGFIFHNNSDAERYVLELRDNTELRMKIQASARASVVKMYSDDFETQVFQFYARA